VLQKDMRTLMRDNFSQVFAKVFPLYYCDEETAKLICDDMLSEWITQEDHNEIIPKNFNLILIELLNSLSFEKNPTAPMYSTECITDILGFISERWKFNVADMIYVSR